MVPPYCITVPILHVLGPYPHFCVQILCPTIDRYLVNGHPVGNTIELVRAAPHTDLALPPHLRNDGAELPLGQRELRVRLRLLLGRRHHHLRNNQ